MKVEDQTPTILTNLETISLSTIQVFKLSDIHQNSSLIAVNSIRDQPLSFMIYRKATKMTGMILNDVRIHLLNHHSSKSRWSQGYV